VFDCIGPIADSPWPYALGITDLQTRWPSAYALSSLSAKAVCKALIEFFSIFGVRTYCHSDRGANFTSQLTCLMLQRMGCSLRFNTPNRSLSTGLVERTNQSLKHILAKPAEKHLRIWPEMLPFALFTLHTAVNETTGVEPCLWTFGRRLRTPLQILKDNWTERKPLLLDIAKSTAEYMYEIETNLELACQYAEEHGAAAQKRYADRYNLREREKEFVVGDFVIYLSPSSTN